PPVVAEPIDEVDVTPPSASSGRTWRRMDVDQLKASMSQISGGVEWTEIDDDGLEFDVIDSLSGSLGKPDFLDSNTEDLQPGLLFAKFLDDSAVAVCRRWMGRERDQPGQRLLLVHADLSDTPQSAPDAIAANLSAALLRFHGRVVPVGDARLTPWIDLFSQVWSATGEDTFRAWRTVCVAMFTHPDFYNF
ncbi:MAG: hypothetical protein AAGC55_32935, partial [Myxococcota bacterium]